MNATFHTGDVLERYSSGRGWKHYIRVGDTDPIVAANGHIYVYDTDAAGFRLNNRGRYLQARTLTTRYRIHHRAQENHA